MQRHYRKYIEALKKETHVVEPSGRHRLTGGEAASSKRHYLISERSRGYLKLYQWAVDENTNDPAVQARAQDFYIHGMLYSPVHQDFIPSLKNHLLARILHCQYDQEPATFTDHERNNVQIVSNRLEQRFTMTVYYTTYDLRRGADKINMKGRPYVMALSHDDPSHPYVYARVLGVYRVKVLHPTMAAPTSMDVLWVHWLQIDHTYQAGWKAKRLYRVKFVPNLEEGAFGFLNPNDVIRGAHLIPGFSKGFIVNLLAASISRWDYPSKANWKYFYVNQ